MNGNETLFIPKDDKAFSQIYGINKPNQLEIINGPENGRCFSFYESITIGRNQDSETALKDPGISLKHALIQKIGHQYFYIPIQAQNISFVNDMAVDQKKCLLKSQDIITVGRTQLRIKLESIDHDDSNEEIPLKTPSRFFEKHGNHRLYISICIVVFLLFYALFPGKPKSGIEIPSAIAESKELKIRLETCHNLFQSSQFNKAKACYQDILRHCPKNSESLLRMAQCQQQINTIRKENQIALENRINAMIQQSYELENQNNFQQAIDLLTEGQNIAPDNALFSLRIEHIQKKNEEINQRQRSREMHEQQLADIRNRFQSAMQKKRNNDFYQALKDLESIVALNISCHETQQAVSLIPKLQIKLIKETKIFYVKGKKHYPKNKGLALKYFYKAFTLYPDYEDVKMRVDELIRTQEPVAKRLYGDAIIYEGINRLKKTQKILLDIINRVMPVENHIYYKKAHQKLSEIKA